MSKSILDQVRENRAECVESLREIDGKIRSAPASGARSLRSAKTALDDEIQQYDERITELQAAEARSALANALHVELGTGGTEGRAHVGSEAEVYRPDRDQSFFRDVHAARVGDYAAAERLHRNNQMRGQETRAGDMTTVSNAGGQFAPPAWLVDEWVALARPGRVTADLMTKQALPAGVSSLNLPRIATGSGTAVQATQNTGVQDTTVTTNAVSSGITTIAGQQIVSLQLLEQSGVAFDRVILGDLAADYAKQIDVQVISGSGAGGNLRGLLNGASVGATTYTTATPKVIDGTTPANSFYNKIVSAVNSVATARFLPATAIVMHPQRWSWILEALDSSSRPLILTNGGAFNAPGISGEPVAQGAAGSLLSLPVYTDPNIPINLGAGTNEDRVFVLRAADCFLWETALSLQSFDATYANQMSVLFRASAYSAFIPDRLGAAVNVIAGTGLVSPTL